MKANLECKREYLRKYRILLMQIERKQRELDLWFHTWNVLEQETAAYGVADRITTVLCEVQSLRNEIGEEIKDLLALKRKIEAAISAVEDERLQLILQYHYIDGLTMEAVSDKMHYAHRHIIRLHLSALEMIKLPEKIMQESAS